MAYVFRSYKTRTGPDRKRVFVMNAKGRKVPHVRWRFMYVDWQGRRRIASGNASRSETEKLAARVQAREDEIRLGFRPAPKSSDMARTRPIAEVIEEYLAWGNTQGGRGGRPWGVVHANKRLTHLAWWRKQLSLETLADLEGAHSRVEAALRELSAAKRAGKTLENYRDAISAFCNWCVKRGYLDGDPLKNLTAWDKTPRVRRRPLGVPEIQALLTKCRPQFRLLYWTAGRRSSAGSGLESFGRSRSST